MVEKKRVSARAKKIQERANRRREEHWPSLSDWEIWSRGTSDGFSTIPRTLTLISTIADSLANKNKRVSATYIGLWCRVWDAAMVVVDNEFELATEAGFSGERRIYTWRDRMRQLSELGFIDVKAGPKGPFQFVLIFNPYHVLQNLRASGEVQDHFWQALIERAEDIGAEDLHLYQDYLKKMKNLKKTKSAK